MSEALTPVQVEDRLRRLVNGIAEAQAELARARRAEVEAEIAHRRALAIAWHDPACPRVERGGRTVAERDAWIDAQAEAQWVDHRLAVVAREVAQDSLRAVLAQCEVVRSLSASVRTSYEQAGRS